MYANIGLFAAFALMPVLLFAGFPLVGIGMLMADGRYGNDYLAVIACVYVLARCFVCGVNMLTGIGSPDRISAFVLFVQRGYLYLNGAVLAFVDYGAFFALFGRSAFAFLLLPDRFAGLFVRRADRGYRNLDLAVLIAYINDISFFGRGRSLALFLIGHPVAIAGAAVRFGCAKSRNRHGYLAEFLAFIYDISGFVNGGSLVAVFLLGGRPDRIAVVVIFADRGYLYLDSAVLAFIDYGAAFG